MYLFGNWIDLDKTWLTDDVRRKTNPAELTLESLQWLQLAIENNLTP